MVKFTYNNAKNAKIDNKFFILNCKYHSCIFYKKNLNLYLKLRIIKKHFFKLQELITIYQQNLYYA